MTLAQALHLIQTEQKKIASAACYQNSAALEVKTASALFSQNSNADAARRLTLAAEQWQAYRAENPQAEV